MAVDAPGCRPASPGFTTVRGRGPSGVHPARALRFLVQDIRNIHRFFTDTCEIIGEQEIFPRIGGVMFAGRGGISGRREMTREEIRVSGDRIGVLIGTAGATKKSLEEKTGSTISVDSTEGIVVVEGEDAVGVISAVEVIRAIAKGFSPERAFVLLKDEYLLLDVIDLTHVADTTQQMDRIRGRVIGKDGKSRERIEHMTGTSISVHHKTVAIIGSVEHLKPAKIAVEMLINGVPHEVVFAFLERKKQDATQDLLGSYY